MSIESVIKLLSDAEIADDCFQVMDGVDPRDILALQVENDLLRAALRALEKCDGSPDNVSSAEVLAARVRRFAHAALAQP